MRAHVNGHSGRVFVRLESEVGLSEDIAWSSTLWKGGVLVTMVWLSPTDGSHVVHVFPLHAAGRVANSSSAVKSASSHLCLSSLSRFCSRTLERNSGHLRRSDNHAFCVRLHKRGKETLVMTISCCLACTLLCSLFLSSSSEDNFAHGRLARATYLLRYARITRTAGVRLHRGKRPW